MKTTDLMNRESFASLWNTDPRLRAEALHAEQRAIESDPEYLEWLDELANSNLTDLLNSMDTGK